MGRLVFQGATGMVQYGVADGVALLRFDAPPLNTITLALLEHLRAALGRANRETAVRGIVITGGATHFSAGADLVLFRGIASREDAIRASWVYQEAFQEIEDSAKPVVAAVAGSVVGTALELALACHWRVCTPETTFSLPEVTLGINPGAGGTQRLPRLIGLEAALLMLLTGKPMDAEAALAGELVDAVCDGGAMLEAARRVLDTAGAPRMTSRRTAIVRDASRNTAAFAGAEKLLARVPPEVIAPRLIAAAVRTGLVESFEAGLRAEQTAFADCMDTRAARNKIYLFFATREMSKAPSLAGVETTAIAKAAVIGMGTMGTGIVQALATAGVPVVVRDEEEAALQKGTARIRRALEKRVGQGQRTPEWLAACSGRITTTTNWQDVADSALVIESVFEDVAVKRAVIARLEALCAPSTIIASNTSTISLDELGAGMRHGERLLGMHFFNPAQHMPLVEIIRREASAGSVVATALKFAKTIRKTPVLVRNRAGFLVNRLFVPYLKEAFWLLQEGAAPAAIDGAMVEFGFAMGPLSLIDMAGLDILVCSDRVLRRAFPRHGVLPAVAERLVAQGQLGQKSGAGVYRYEKGDYAPRPSDTTAGILDGVRREQGLAPRKIEKDEITERLVLRMVSEAFYVLEESIVQRPSDLDVATVLGIGFPDFRGGVLQYARDAGMERVMSKLDRLVAQCGERFSVPGAARSPAAWAVDKGAR